jgi:hypothetical protein
MTAQKYGENPKNTNILSQIKEFRQNRANQVTQAELKHAANFRSDKTSADEVRRWVYFLLLCVTAVTVFLAVQYYTDVFGNSVSPEYAAALAIVAAIAVEVGKIKLLLKVVHAVLFGWWQKSWADLGLWIIVAVLAGGCFWWSVEVSTRGMKEYAANKTETLVSKDTLSTLLHFATADIDAQIAGETASRAKAESSEWKGQQTVYGLKNAKENNKNIGKLQDQRAAIVAQVTQDYKEGIAKRTHRTDALTAFITRCGGYMELAAFLCILALGFIDARLVQVVREGMEGNPDNSPTPPKGAKNETPEDDAKFWQEMRAYARSTAPTANNRADFDDTDNCVTSDTTVSQQRGGQEVFSANEILKAARTELSREAANMKNRNGAAASVAKRIHAVFNRVGRFAEQKAFNPDANQAARYYEVVDTCCELLRSANNPYPYEAPMLKQLSQFLPEDYYQQAA